MFRHRTTAPITRHHRPGLLLVVLNCLVAPICAQNTFPFTSGPIPLCDTSVFTANVSGVGMLNPPGIPWSYWLESLTANITSDHPQTLSISLTSPAGTTILLSAFNGAGGQNYTNTVFQYWGGPSITTGSAPFTGNWAPQSGSFSDFDYELADGTWTITVVDTSCASGGVGPGGTWTPGWFDGDGAGSGAFSFGFSSPPPCMGGIPWGAASICPGETYDILAYYSGFYPWYEYTVTLGWGVPVADPTAVDQAGSYTVDAYDPWEGCWYTAWFDITVNPAIDLGPDEPVVQCSADGPLNLLAMFTIPAGTEAVWHNGAPISNAAATAVTVPGTYQVVGGSGTNCSDTALVFVSFPDSPDLGPDQTVSICQNGAADLTALFNTTGLSTAWSVGGIPLSAPTAATDAGVYTLVATSPEGCSDEGLVTLDVGIPPALGPDQSLSVCEGTPVDLTVLYNTAGLSPVWTRLGSPVTDPTSVTTGGIYRLVLANGAACSDSAFVTISQLPSPQLGSDVSASVCEGATEDLTSYFTLNGATADWTLAGAPVPDASAAAQAGTYRLIASNSGGCTDTAFVDLDVDALPVLGPDQTISVCDGIAVDLTGTYPTGSNSDQWTLAGSVVNDPSSVVQAGTYTLTTTNAAGCSATAMVNVTTQTSPSIGADRTVTVCEGHSLDLTGLYLTDGNTAIWAFNGTALADPGSVEAPGAYRLVVTNAGGCTDTAWVTLGSSPLPSLGTDQSFALCSWQTLDLTTLFNTDGMTVTYGIDGLPVSDPSAVNEAGAYTVSIVDANGCMDEAMVSISALECVCEADFVHDAACVEDPVQFTLVADSAVFGAQWSFAGAATPSTQIDPLVQFATSGPLTVTLQATLSCGVVEVQRTIELAQCADLCNIWIPNSFTPDGDAINDAWSWKSECLPKDFMARIFNRFGEVIYTSTDPTKPWDGTSGGVQTPPGVYAYQVAFTLPYQDRTEVAGSITLVR